MWSDAFFPVAAVPKVVPAELAGPALQLGSYGLRGDPELALLKSPGTSAFLAWSRMLYSGINILRAETFIPLKFSHDSCSGDEILGKTSLHPSQLLGTCFLGLSNGNSGLCASH